MMNLDPALNDTRRVVDEPHARIGLAIVRLTIGAMFVWVFFENLGKGLYKPSGYAGLINNYIENGHAPAAWKSVMALAAHHASMAAPLQGATEISLGVLLVVAKWPAVTEAAGFRRALMLMVIPVLLATDNFFGARTLHGVWNPATFAVTTALISTVLSLCGLILGDALRVRSGAFARSVLMSAILLALGGLVG